MSAAPLPLRARSASEKARRRSEILHAAERLWEHSNYADLSMSHVAKEAKLAKGTLYLYFDTKEELFLALLSEKVHDWLTELADRLEQQPCHDAAALAHLFAEVASREAQTRRLMLLLSSVRGRLSAESLQHFRRDLRQPYERLLTLLPYERSVSYQMLIHAYALVMGWQQVSDDDSLMLEPHWSGTKYPGQGDRVQGERHLALALEAVIERLRHTAGHSPEPQLN